MGIGNLERATFSYIELGLAVFKSAFQWDYVSAENNDIACGEVSHNLSHAPTT